MDILQRAAGMIDRAQVRVADATQQVARSAITTTRLRALELRQIELRAQIEAAVMDLGRLTFQRWKNHGVGNDGELSAMCHAIDALNIEYQTMLGHIADARASGLPPPEYRQPSLPVLHPPGISAMPGYAVAYEDPAVDYNVYPAEQYIPGAASAYPPSNMRVSPKPARECPECFTLVPGADSFCPSCGLRV
jgi:hypothetical protein